jgi:hypothetical protein
MFEMRRILLTSAAILGGTAVLAHAGAPAPLPITNSSQRQPAGLWGYGPSTTTNNAWGIANTPTKSAVAGSRSPEYAPNVIVPGTVLIRLTAWVELNITANFTSVDKGLNTNGKPNGFCLNPVGVASYLRLYPGLDGLAR